VTLKKHLERHPRFQGTRGLRRLAQHLANGETPPAETMLPATATVMEHAVAARIGRTWHQERTAYYLAELEAMLDGRPHRLSKAHMDRIADAVGVSRNALVGVGGNKMLRNATIICALLAVALASQQASAAEEVVSLGTLLDDVALNSSASSLTFYIGRRVNDSNPTSSTDSSSGDAVKEFDKVRLEVSFDYGATSVALTLTCTEGQTRATATGRIPTATYDSGTYTLEWAGVVTSPSMSADTIYPIEFRTRQAEVIKCVISSSGSPGASDKVSVSGWVTKSKGV